MRYYPWACLRLLVNGSWYPVSISCAAHLLLVVCIISVLNSWGLATDMPSICPSELGWSQGRIQQFSRVFVFWPSVAWAIALNSSKASVGLHGRGRSSSLCGKGTRWWGAGCLGSSFPLYTKKYTSCEIKHVRSKKQSCAHVHTCTHTYTHIPQTHQSEPR